MDKKTLAQLGLALICFILLIFLIGLSKVITKDGESDEEARITSFEECAAAGNPIMESYPEQCRTEDGRTFTRVISEPNDPFFNATSTGPLPAPRENIVDPGTPVSNGGCFVGGCSAQICSDQNDMASTCEYRPEYQCYSKARCERQPNGQCGWTETPEFKQCIVAASQFMADGVED